MTKMEMETILLQYTRRKYSRAKSLGPKWGGNLLYIS